MSSCEIVSKGVTRQDMCRLQEEERLAGQARWCRKYARANAAGLRKIAKKHDKRAANDAGRRFVQVRCCNIFCNT